MQGLRLGFDIGVTRELRERYERKNLQSALREKDFATVAPKQEVENGYIAGPAPFQQYRVSSIGIVTGRYSCKKRLILDLSAPHEDDQIPSVNSCINKSECSLKYVTIDDAITVIRKLGREHG